MENNNIRNSSYEQTLAGVTKDLSDLRANILGKLSREILILQAQKNALTDDIQRLQSQRKELEVLTVAQQGMNQQRNPAPAMDRATCPSNYLSSKK